MFVQANTGSLSFSATGICVKIEGSLFLFFFLRLDVGRHSGWGQAQADQPHVQMSFFFHVGMIHGQGDWRAQSSGLYLRTSLIL